MYSVAVIGKNGYIGSNIACALKGERYATDIDMYC